MGHPPTDEQLLTGLLEGQQEMFGSLVHRYEQSLYAFICRMTGNEADAADLFQDTFLRVYKYRDSFRGQSSFKTWLYTIARNVCRTHTARMNSLPVSIEEFDWDAENGAPQVSSVLELKEAGERIARAVAVLPEAQREVFMLKAYEEMKYPEIARVLQRPIGTVKSQMRYALRKLRGELGGLVRS